MAHHDHNHAHDHSHPHSHGPKAKVGLHKNWKVWLVVGLMVLCMIIYILTLDEAVQPR